MTRRKKRRDVRPYYYVAIVLAALLYSYLLFFTPSFEIQEEKDQESDFPNIPVPVRVPRYHAHVDFRVVIDGNDIDFSKEKYNEAHAFVHLHMDNPNGDKVIHIHKEEVTMGFFFETLGITFNSECFIVDDVDFCNKDDKTIKMLVNGEKNTEFDTYRPKDVDRILITYGDESTEEIAKQMDGVTDDACLFSNKCPEKLPGGARIVNDRIVF